MPSVSRILLHALGPSLTVSLIQPWKYATQGPFLVLSPRTKETTKTTMMMTMMLAFRLVRHLEDRVQSCEICLSCLPSHRLWAYLQIQQPTRLPSLQASLLPPSPPPPCLLQLWLLCKPPSIPTQ